MRILRIKLYKFNELSAKAKKVAIENHRDKIDTEFVIGDAYSALEKFAKIFEIELTSIDLQNMYRSEYYFHLIEEVIELSGQRLATYLWNNYKKEIYKGKYYGKLVDTEKDGTPIVKSKEHPAGVRHVKRYSKCTLSTDCVLTGVCYDLDLLDPMYKFIDRPTNKNFRQLLMDCMRSLANSVDNEIDAMRGDEYVTEQLENSDYEFTIDGKLYK